MKQYSQDRLPNLNAKKGARKELKSAKSSCKKNPDLPGWDR